MRFNRKLKHRVLKTPRNDIMMSLAIVGHMADSGVNTVAFIGFADRTASRTRASCASAARLKIANGAWKYQPAN